MLKLMIVDDSAIIRRKIERSCLGSKFEVVGTAKNGKEAIDIFEQTKPDVITMDLTMPEMDGIACVELIKRCRPQTNILVVSALADIETGILALEKGARGFLCKPFKDEELVSALEELME